MKKFSDAISQGTLWCLIEGGVGIVGGGGGLEKSPKPNSQGGWKVTLNLIGIEKASKQCNFF